MTAPVIPPKADPPSALQVLGALTKRADEADNAIVRAARERCEPILAKMVEPLAKLAALDKAHRPRLLQIQEALGKSQLQRFESLARRRQQCGEYLQQALGLMNTTPHAAQRIRDVVAGLTLKDDRISYISQWCEQAIVLVLAAPGGIERALTQMQEHLRWITEHGEALALGKVNYVPAPPAPPQPQYAQSALSPPSGQREG